MLKNPFVDSLVLTEADRRKILVFTTQQFMLIEMKKNNVTWIINKTEIENVIGFKNGVKINLSQVVPQSRINNFARRPHMNNERDVVVKKEFKVIGKF